jgi:TolB protein
MRHFMIGLAICVAASPLWTAPARQEEKQPETLLIVSKRTGNAEIFLIDAKGEKARNLTNSNSENSYPAWSPDGKSIAFASDRDGAMNIYVMDADGKNVKQLTKGDERSRCPAWSPDGKKIAFGRSIGDGGGIFVMDADGANAKQIGDGDEWNPAWSPDGKAILFASRRDGDGFRLYLMDADGGNVKQLTTNANPFGSVYPCFSPDGKKIMWADGNENGLEIHVADADGKNIQKLTDLGGVNTFAAWSLDGKSIVFQHLPDYSSGPIYIMDADGGNRRELSKNEPLVKGARPAWLPK